ncbi:MAG TPA: TonB-dependent receptor [Puia sp.]|nr:TonB-dependent receptor [Puia sp.]
MGYYARPSAYPVYRVSLTILFVVGFGCMSPYSYGQTPDSLLPYNALKKLSLEELMNIDVISVSRHPEKLDGAASAIQVITQEDIRRSGAKTLPEALRLAPNLQVAQVNSSQWAISARGFNNVLANKLLVLIDGRTVYTPLYAGVFWDVQNLLLEDIDRIEVVSGPGGTLWGANAVNGVINIITKSAKNTHGLFAEAATGTAFPVLGSLRYGGQFSDKLSYRVYGTGFKLGNTLLAKDTKANDEWPMIQGGFRLDWDASAKDKVSLQSNIYGGKPNPDGGDTAVKANGDNIVARWDHKSSERSDFRLQAYYDHTLRDFGNGFTEDLKTWDVEWQDRHQLGLRHVLTYGLDLRVMDHKVTNLELFAFLPAHKTLYLYSGFVQDEMMLIRDRLRLTIGAKIEHNSYTGFEYQPDARLTWTPAKNQTIWGAVSRAVRTPARIDRDFYLYILPNLPLISGNETFTSEDMLAYEAGWRIHPQTNLQFAVSAFYNVYDNIRSAEPGPPPLNIPITFGNGVKGNSYGVELSATAQLTSWWSLRGGYTFLRKDLSVKPGSNDQNKGSAESDDPEHQFLLQSNMELPGRIELGTVVRYVGKLPAPRVPDYTGWDVRIGWKITRAVELDIVGQNLLNSPHIEFIPSSPSPRQIEHGLYGKVICRL